MERKCEMETCQGMLWCPRAHVFWGWSSRMNFLQGNKGYVYFRLPFKLLAWNAWCINVHHERYYVVGSWEFVLVLLLNVVYIQSHASAVIDLCIDNRTGVYDIRAVSLRVSARSIWVFHQLIPREQGSWCNANAVRWQLRLELLVPYLLFTDFHNCIIFFHSNLFYWSFVCMCVCVCVCVYVYVYIYIYIYIHTHTHKRPIKYTYIYIY